MRRNTEVSAKRHSTSEWRTSVWAKDQPHWRREDTHIHHALPDLCSGLRRPLLWIRGWGRSLYFYSWIQTVKTSLVPLMHSQRGHTVQCFTILFTAKMQDLGRSNLFIPFTKFRRKGRLPPPPVPSRRRRMLQAPKMLWGPTCHVDPRTKYWDNRINKNLFPRPQKLAKWSEIISKTVVTGS